LPGFCAQDLDVVNLAAFTVTSGFSRSAELFAFGLSFCKKSITFDPGGSTDIHASILRGRVRIFMYFF
jgi:hypothetical protein